MTDKIQWGTGGSAELILRALRQAYPTCANNIKQKVTKKTAFVSCKGRF